MPSNRSTLSTRERQLLKLAATGMTDSAISARLGIQASTVKTYWRRLREKLGGSSRTELVATVLRGELERANHSLRAAEFESASEAKAQRAYYKMLIEHAPDAILVVDPDGRIQVINDMALDFFGWEEDEIVGRHLSELLPERFRSNHPSQMVRYFASPTKRAMGDHIGTYALHKTGIEIPIAAKLSLVEVDGQHVVICVVRPTKLPK